MGHALRLGRTRSVTACVVLAVALLFAASPTADAARFIGHISEPVSWAFLAKCVPLGRRLARPGPVEPARPFGSGSRRWRPEFDTSSLRADPTRATAPRRFCFLPADAGILAKEVQGMIQTKIKFHVRLPARPPGRPRSPAPNLRACRTPISDISPSRELTSPGSTLRVRRTPPPHPADHLAIYNLTLHHRGRGREHARVLQKHRQLGRRVQVEEDVRGAHLQPVRVSISSRRARARRGPGAPAPQTKSHERRRSAIVVVVHGRASPERAEVAVA